MRANSTRTGTTDLRTERCRVYSSVYTCDFLYPAHPAGVFCHATCAKQEPVRGRARYALYAESHQKITLLCKRSSAEKTFSRKDSGPLSPRTKRHRRANWEKCSQTDIKNIAPTNCHTTNCITGRPKKKYIFHIRDIIIIHICICMYISLFIFPGKNFECTLYS